MRQQDLAAFDEVVTEVRRLFFALRGVTDALLADLDCTAPERSLLLELAKGGPQTVPTLARTRAISRQAMQKVVDRLLAREWLDVAPNPAHERSSLLVLSPAGERVFAEIRRREAALVRARPLPVSSSELRRVTGVLRQLCERFEEPDAEGDR